MFKNILIYILLLICLIFGNENKKKVKVLESLSSSKKIMKNSSRKLYTTIKNEKVFDKLFINTSLSCAYVIRYYFNTEIILGYHTNKLVSLDGSIFYLKKEQKNPENITKEVIEIISSMFYGSKEFELFKNSIDENIKLN
tara:strand:+ start:3342 stop:3761 length:420 start_codon:yes stop_codon:yes gene_type:complete